ncbi:NAC domain-containing protein 41-like [Gossypium arboreum]|uniref:NAC domain-containing protein n=1 Tax=Gossypium arboreum TaxID=29729 RepID=A0ABR0PS08_GOSAR|nr:NAC domain-containing protein 41-like [Gossypium arboreum]KAK5827020.1 hypothetical protein PVK06_021954 [Gossypium arboreum]
MEFDSYEYQFLMTGIPPGYRFEPTDIELLQDYLWKKVNGDPLPYNIISECEIYGNQDKEPWNVFIETSTETFYVFTKLKKKGKGKNIDRVAGCGTWKGQKTDPIMYEKMKIGNRKLFVYEVKGSNEGVKGHWIMHEFSLVDEEDKQIGDYVVCSIRNKNAKDDTDDEEPPMKKTRFNLEDHNPPETTSSACPLQTLLSDWS